MAGLKTITGKDLKAAEANWNCQACGQPITMDDPQRVLFASRRMGAVVVNVPLRWHGGC